MSGSGSGLLDPGLIKGVEMHVQMESRSICFVEKVASSLQRADLSFMNSVTRSVCRAKCTYILQDTYKDSTFNNLTYNIHKCSITYLFFIYCFK